MSTFLLDVNVLIALAWPSHVHHARARAWWDGVSDWATTPVTESAFVRLSVNPAVVGTAVSVSTALAVLRAIRGAPGHRYIDDTASLAEPTIDLTRVATPGQITDAHLVNLAAASGCVLATLDAGIPRMVSPEDRRHILLLPH